MRTDFPFINFERSIEILVAESDYSGADLCRRYLSRHKLYSVAAASTAAEADTLLASKRFHVCLFDPGGSGTTDDEFHLLNKYSPKVSFIAVSGRTSIETGFSACELGVFAAISKPIDFAKPDILNFINEAFFRSLIIPENLKECKPAIKDAIKSFMSNKPDTVSNWAEKARLEERYLRRVWGVCFKYPPKNVIWLYKVLNDLFSCYNAIYFKELGISLNANGNNGREMETSLQLFYNHHKKGILEILNRRKNLVNRAF